MDEREDAPDKPIFRDLKDIELSQEEINDRIPWITDNLEHSLLQEEQKLMPEWALGVLNENDYIIVNGLLYTVRRVSNRPEYPRLVLPPSARSRAIHRAHIEVGHMSVRKTVERLQEAYQWPGILKDVIKVIKRCGSCEVHKRRPQRLGPGHFPFAEYPGQLVGADLSGPYPTSAEGNSYILSVVDYATGWVESYPLPNKEAKTVFLKFEKEYIPRYGPPEVLIFDNGKEFKNHILVPYLKHLGTNVRFTPPYSPQTNGKIERWHRTLKEMLGKLVNARPESWETHLAASLWAHRITTSSVTGFSPYFLNFGREPPIAWQSLICKPLHSDVLHLAERLDTYSEALRTAALKSNQSKLYNKLRLEGKANAEEVQVGDYIAIKNPIRTSLEPIYDHGWVVTRVRGNVIWALGPKNKRRVVARRNVLRTTPEANWAQIRSRLSKAQRRAIDLAGKSPRMQATTNFTPPPVSIPTGIALRDELPSPASIEAPGIEDPKPSTSRDPDFEAPVLPEVETSDRKLRDRAPVDYTEGSDDEYADQDSIADSDPMEVTTRVDKRSHSSPTRAGPEKRSREETPLEEMAPDPPPDSIMDTRSPDHAYVRTRPLTRLQLRASRLRKPLRARRTRLENALISVINSLMNRSDL